MSNASKSGRDWAAEVGDYDDVFDLQRNIGQLQARVSGLVRSIEDTRADTIELRHQFESAVCDMSDIQRQTARAFSQSTSQQVRADLSLARDAMRARSPFILFGMLTLFLCALIPPIAMVYRQVHDVTHYVTVLAVHGPFTARENDQGTIETGSPLQVVKQGQQIAWTLKMSLRPDTTARAIWKIVPDGSKSGLDAVVLYAVADPSKQATTLTASYAVPPTTRPGDYQIIGSLEVYPGAHGRIVVPRERLAPIRFRVSQ